MSASRAHELAPRSWCAILMADFVACQVYPMPICPSCQTTTSTMLAPCPTGDGFFTIDDAEYASHSSDRLLGRQIAGRFIVTGILGHGSMGYVYKGWQGQVERTVALKIFRPEFMQRASAGGKLDEGVRDAAQQRFVQEARVLGKLSHPNCVTVYDFGVSDEGDFLYIAMEYVSGISLRKAVRRGLKMPAILAIGRQILDALREAHAMGIVHRDLKPENIILSQRSSSEEQVVKVLDFGIAKQLGSATQMTQTGQIFGTPQYMSPEQCQGHAIDGRSDLYSLGCILYELIGGRPPFHAETPMAVLMAHVFNQAEPLDVHSSGLVPVAVEDIVFRLLAKAPDDRYATAAEVRDALQAALDNLKADDRSSRPLSVLRAEAEPPAARLEGDAALIHAAPTLDVVSTKMHAPPGLHGSHSTNETASIALANTALSPAVSAADRPVGAGDDDFDDLDEFAAGMGGPSRTVVAVGAALVIALVAGGAFFMTGGTSNDDGAADDVTAPVTATAPASEAAADHVAAGEAATAQAGGEAPPEAPGDAAAEVVRDEAVQDEAMQDEAALDPEPEPAVAASAPKKKTSTTKRTTTKTARPATSTARSMPQTRREEPKASAPAAAPPRKVERDPFDFFNE